MTLHFLNDVANELNLIIASLKSETMCKLINRIPGSCFMTFISSLPLITHVESLGKPGGVNKRYQSHAW